MIEAEPKKQLCSIHALLTQPEIDDCLSTLKGSASVAEQPIPQPNRTAADGPDAGKAHGLS
jgi:hypothetical protein